MRVGYPIREGGYPLGYSFWIEGYPLGYPFTFFEVEWIPFFFAGMLGIYWVERTF
jgi:hypothetical protein